ncbi:hypothetical protein Rsub_01143 [Raphidocelis subcapitata]|uniref:Uncharacterized protein n=1 Tax=Raphidocelis subcapitata TaxID=307507 RepID=A0A2V0NLW5_9CHLO|nr:hypothetical protein Rsub_01143 [Raphidocelis subcapitata]|eukprot:GBF88431.1 hypothetical protein Rsub_01143 [Raphidocelis subcapitata]
MGKPQPGSVIGALRRLDAFPKVNEDFFQKTTSGGVITVVAYSFMLLLFLSETRLYLGVHRSHELVVDSSRGETIAIDLDVVFPRMPCAWLSLDAMDVSGELHLDVDHDVYKQRLASNGAPIAQAERHVLTPPSKEPLPAAANGTGAAAAAGAAAAGGGAAGAGAGSAAAACGSCYGAESSEQPCCNTCDEGSVHIHDMSPFESKTLDFAHKINRLSFGPHYPGHVNPLDGASSGGVAGGGGGKVGMYQYFLKVVPTLYVATSNASVASNQYSVTEHFRETPPLGGSPTTSTRTLPGLFFFYDLSPIKVHILESRSSFLHYLTNLCAIVGGVFAVSSLVDGGVHLGQQAIRKARMGKLS